MNVVVNSSWQAATLATPTRLAWEREVSPKTTGPGAHLPPGRSSEPLHCTPASVLNASHAEKFCHSPTDWTLPPLPALAHLASGHRGPAYSVTLPTAISFR